ncbi:MAG: NAD(P)H-binding protein [Myxococcota bacterium]
MRVFVVGATGYIGRQVVRALLDRGHEVVAFARPRSGVGAGSDEAATREVLDGAEVRFGEVTQVSSISQDGFRGESFEAVVSCLATRTGGVEDAWSIEHRANAHVLSAARERGVQRFVLLSAICVQKPRLAFQFAKLAFEEELMASGLIWSIVRPTAYFKSLAGQVESVRAGRPFVMFGNGLTPESKPIGERDLARYVAGCLDDPSRANRILPIGGPGPVITPRVQGELLSTALGRTPRFRRVPLWLFDGIIMVLSGLGRVSSWARDKAEFARIGRYYASESMLVWDDERGVYDPEATPSYGEETLEAFYGRVAAEGIAGQELGDHSLFTRKRTPS